MPEKVKKAIMHDLMKNQKKSHKDAEQETYAIMNKEGLLKKK